MDLASGGSRGSRGGRSGCGAGVALEHVAGGVADADLEPAAVARRADHFELLALGEVAQLASVWRGAEVEGPNADLDLIRDRLGAQGDHKDQR